MDTADGYPYVDGAYGSGSSAAACARDAVPPGMDVVGSTPITIAGHSTTLYLVTDTMRRGYLRFLWAGAFVAGRCVEVWAGYDQRDPESVGAQKAMCEQVMMSLAVTKPT